jgi:hypothetical protein
MVNAGRIPPKMEQCSSKLQILGLMTASVIASTTRTSTHLPLFNLTKNDFVDSPITSMDLRLLLSATLLAQLVVTSVEDRTG